MAFIYFIQAANVAEPISQIFILILYQTLLTYWLCFRMHTLTCTLSSLSALGHWEQQRAGATMEPWSHGVPLTYLKRKPGAASVSAPNGAPIKNSRSRRYPNYSVVLIHVKKKKNAKLD